MYNMKTEQKIFDIGGVKVGGLPGKDPTVLIGTIFYKREKLVKDEKKGLFDKEKAEKYIRRQEELSDVTGIPCILDIEGATVQSMERYISFVADVTEVPFMLGGPTPEVRRKSLKLIEEGGYANRVIYNSLMPGCGKEEISWIIEAGIESAVLLAYNVTDMTSQGRLNSLKELLELTEEQGIGKPLLDTFIMDVPSLGIAFKTFLEAKSTFGFPVGGGPHNAIGLWKGLHKKMGLKSKRSIVASVNAFAAASGADWILYGPIEFAGVAFPAVAMVDAAYAFPRIQAGIRLSRNHPLFRIA
jgi:tetrahydromethanopterin S-methyltransferase subunit H